jgi:hypothetical protein
VGLEVGRTELVQAEDDFRLAVLGYDLAFGDRVEVLDAGFLGGVVRVAGGLPGLYALKRDALLAEQDPVPLRMIRSRRCLSSPSISRTRTRSVIRA